MRESFSRLESKVRQRVLRCMLVCQLLYQGELVMTVEFFLVFEIDVGVEVERCISTITITMFIDYTIYT